MATGLTVGDNDLVNEALDMIETQGVIEVMQNYGYDPNDRSGRDLTTVWNEIFNNRWGLMMNPCTDLHNLFKGFDSHWHNTAQNQAQVTYTGCSSSTPVVPWEPRSIIISRACCSGFSVIPSRTDSTGSARGKQSRAMAE